MSIFGKIADKISGIDREIKLINDLCEHLQQIGVNATVLNREDPEVKEFLASGEGLGYIKIEGRNLDLIKIGQRSYQTTGPRGQQQTHREYYYEYMIWGTVDPPHVSEESKLKDVGVFKLLRRFDLLDDPGPTYSLVGGQSTRKGFIRKQVVDFQWEGGDLAQRLNADFDLKNMLMRERLHNIYVYYHDWKMGKFVEIDPTPNTLERKTFPIPETFELYDRLAHHLRSIMKVEKLG